MVMKAGRPWGRLAFVATGLVSVIQSAEARGSCREALSFPAQARATMHDVRPIDLIRLRDFGEAPRADAASPFALSPDRSTVALILRQADPVTNSLCIGLVVAAVDGQSTPRLLDAYRVFDEADASEQSLRNNPVQFASRAVPRWSLDGRWIAFLKQEGGVSQIWRASVDGEHVAAVTRSTVDVEQFEWTSDGRSLVYTTRPGAVALESRINEEALRGFHFDDRIQPARTARPGLAQSASTEMSVIDIESRTVSRADAEQSALLLPTRQPGEPSTSASGTTNNLGDTARIVAEDTTLLFSPTRLVVSWHVGSQVRCEAAECANPIGIWWSDDDASVVFLRREGWARSELGLYRWNPRSRAPIRIATTNALLIGCQSVAAGLLCAQESAVQPRRLVILDPSTGRTRPIFDPNPEVAAWRFGTVERLRWRNEFGLETFGDLVLPPNHHPGERLPLIVVGYTSEGFLRGGTGDEYPIHAFAARGYAVLSFQRPVDVALAMRPRTAADFMRLDTEDWADRRSVHSSLMAGIGLLRSRNLIDSDRIGLTGFSDGATTATWALIHSDAFAAVAISQCCIGPTSSMSTGGIPLADAHRAGGFPPLSALDVQFWRATSLESNADRIRTPILIQASGDEWRFALPTIMTLREQGRPAEMYVFPREGHIKWQPAHRLAIYERSLSWFDFWLRGREAGAPDELERWRGLRNQVPRQQSSSTAVHATQ
jgi:dipeptidyl aminopeptidase/acylaminoacyl peptidase